MYYVLLLTLEGEHDTAGLQANTYTYQLFVDTGCIQEDSPGDINDKDVITDDSVRKMFAICMNWLWIFLVISSFKWKHFIRAKLLFLFDCVRY